MKARLGVLSILLLAMPLAVRAQTVSGVVFDDRDADGIQDAGEPGIEGVEVVLYGRTDGGGTVDQTVSTASDGSYSFSPGDGFYLVMPIDPSGWRLGPSRSDGFVPGATTYAAPVGEPRFSKLDQAIDHLRSGELRYAGMGDSIAFNWSSCPSILSPPPPFDYSHRITERLGEVNTSATVTLLLRSGSSDESYAEKGEHTDDLLIDDGVANRNNAFAVIADQPELITISMIGNDLLDVDQANPSQAQINLAVSEILDARQNLQEAISSMISEIPGVDVAINTLYDNEAQSCSTTSFHRQWVSIIGRLLRDLAWGQKRRASINEVYAELAHEDQFLSCTGFTGRICNGLFDGIHPNDDGYEIVLEKVWEALGGVILGPVLPSSDGGSRLQLNPIARSSLSGVNFGYLRRVRRVLPATSQSVGGASVQDPQDALSDADGGAPAAITLGAVGDEFRVGGFADWFDEIEIVRVVAGVNYRTSGGAFESNAYRMEASVDGQFRPPPQHDFDATHWNFYTPIVGGGGPNQPANETPSFTNNEVLVVPNPVFYREVTATLTKNPILPGGAAEYAWPAVTHGELATTEIRVAVTSADTPCTAPCPAIELDYAWLDLYGWEKPRPVEAANVEVDRLGDGTLEISFDPVAGATRYNLYFGRLATVRGGSHDHGAAAPAGPQCAAATQSAGGSRLKFAVPVAQQPGEDADILVTAHVDDVESPAGQASDGTEIDRSQSICQ